MNTYKNFFLLTNLKTWIMNSIFIILLTITFSKIYNAQFYSFLLENLLSDSEKWYVLILIFVCLWKAITRFLPFHNYKKYFENSDLKEFSDLNISDPNWVNSNLKFKRKDFQVELKIFFLFWSRNWAKNESWDVQCLESTFQNFPTVCLTQTHVHRCTIYENRKISKNCTFKTVNFWTLFIEIFKIRFLYHTSNSPESTCYLISIQKRTIQTDKRVHNKADIE